ncbi:MAG: LarC family nickel insertion protein, partial [Kiritimatiellaeota bacterium]|nr:LarC family nickel insertion protein [Kiritimatiellota bacterium]
PEWIASLADELLKRGALDVWQTPVVMKKGRSGIVLRVLAQAEHAERLRECIFRSTTTFGIRFYPVQRETLAREMETVQTPYGEVPVKLGFYKGELVTAAPEHDACAALARTHGVPVRQVADVALTRRHPATRPVPCAT